MGIRALRTLAMAAWIIGGIAWGGAARAGDAPAREDAPILVLTPGGHTAQCRFLAFSPDGRSLYSAGDDKVVYIWDVSDPTRPTLTRSIRMQIGAGSEGKIFAGAVSPDGKTLALGGYFDDDGIRLVDVSTGCVRGILKGHGDVTPCLTFSSDGRFLASSSADRTVRVWDASSQTLVATLTGHEKRVDRVAFLPAAAPLLRLASGSYDNSVRLWRIGPPDADGKRPWECERVLSGHQAEVDSLGATALGRRIASGSFDKTIRIWDSDSGNLIKTLDPGYSSRASSVAFSPDGRRLVTAGHLPNRCHLFSLGDGDQWSETAHFDGHDNTITTCVFSPDGNQIASTGGTQSQILLWDPSTGKESGRMVGAGSDLYSAAYSPDGRFIAFGQAGGGQVLTATMPLEQVLDLGSMIHAGPVKPDRQWLRGRLTLDGLSAVVPGESPNALEIREGSATLATIRRRMDYDRIRCYAFTETGGLITGSNFSLALHEAKTGKHLKNFVGHTSEVYAVATSPDRRFLLSASTDQTLKLWNLNDPAEEVHPLLTIFPTTDNRYVIWTEAGYYKASVNADQLFGWQINQGREKEALFINAWQFAKTFDRPDVIERVLEFGSVEKAVQAANADRGVHAPPAADVRTDIKKMLPPAAKILEPADGLVVEGSTVKVIANGASQGGEEVDRMVLLVNGQPPKGSDGKAFAVEAYDAGSSKNRIEREAALEVGTNVIAVMAHGKNSLGAPVTVKVVRSAPAVALDKPNLYVLAVGVSTYQAPENNLKYCDSDARGIADAFKTLDGGLYGKVETRVLVNQDATRSNIVRDLKWLKKSVTQYDVAVCMVSGHGFRNDEDAYFFVPYDFKPDDPEVSSVNWSELTQKLQGLPCKVVFIMDSCHSGQVVRDVGGGGGRRKAPESGIDKVIKEMRLSDSNSGQASLIIMSSSMGKEFSWENDEWQHGAFALSIMEGITSKRLFADRHDTPLPSETHPGGVIGLVDLDQYVTNRVKELTDGNQHPITDRGMVPSFPIATIGKKEQR